MTWAHVPVNQQGRLKEMTMTGPMTWLGAPEGARGDGEPRPSAAVREIVDAMPAWQRNDLGLLCEGELTAPPAADEDRPEPSRVRG